ncbi:hypothetical protein P8452_60900 [Trifolium repens]|nr:Remorin family protein [Trifolium repens]WJX77611.1 hypothetical protein P8452_60900 [Trifolium repens]
MAETQLKAESSGSAAPPVEVDVESSETTTVVEESKSNVAVAEPEKTPVPAKKLSSKGGSFDRDIALAEVAKEKKLSYVKAWEKSEKTKADNKAQKHISSIAAWENSKKAALEAELKKIEEQLEKKKARYGEIMRNKIALVHKEAEEKRAVIEAKRGEEVLKVEEMAAKYRATGTTPKKTIGCF